MHDPFDLYYQEYDEWFERNTNIYLSELNVMKSFIPPEVEGVEIGVGTGRFANPLGIKVGVEPSEHMGQIAKKRGVDVIKEVAEQLPFEDESFNFVLMVTTLCFVEDPLKVLKESYRIIKPSGFILIGFVPLDSYLGEMYLSKKAGSHFYRTARFYTKKEVSDLLEEVGFKNLRFRQTLFVDTNEYIQDYKEGDQEGGFVVIKGEKT